MVKMKRDKNARHSLEINNVYRKFTSGISVFCDLLEKSGIDYFPFTDLVIYSNPVTAVVFLENEE